MVLQSSFNFLWNKNLVMLYTLQVSTLNLGIYEIHLSVSYAPLSLETLSLNQVIKNLYTQSTSIFHSSEEFFLDKIFVSGQIRLNFINVIQYIKICLKNYISVHCLNI